MTEERDSRTAVLRGLANRCPNCGEGRLSQGYLTLSCRSPSLRAGAGAPCC